MSQSTATSQALLDVEGHVCAFFHSEDEEYRVLLPFIKEGFDRSERACHVVEPSRRADHMRRLGEAGIDVADAEARGQLVVLDWEQTYLYGGGFDQQRLVSQYAGARQEGRSQGFLRTRFVAHMEWALETRTFEELAEYEVTSNLAPMNGDVAICAYQIGRWDGQLLVSALRTHPMVILGGVLHENPFYQLPNDFLGELKAGHVMANH